MTTIPTFVQDPEARLDYTWDWAPWLARNDDTISSATVFVPDGLTADGAPLVDEAVVTQKMSGGTLGSSYKVTCQITTDGGRIDERSMYITILDR
ncbi:hypothetical protein ACIRLA_21795 [Streptomyces sp. NPDC102364]|uniref:phage fiber-tail adaptor protein n=1 Tax=Streptomyces sp. NPDC102364 TaxID=3366161 RepID=UPI0037F7AABB